MSEKKTEWTVGNLGYLPGNSAIGRNWIVAIQESDTGARVATAQAMTREELLPLANLIAAAPELLEACKKAREALNTWTAIFAPEFCDPKHVKEACERIVDGGTLHYIATASKAVSDALTKATTP